jgi:hypothetical protein
MYVQSFIQSYKNKNNIILPQVVDNMYNSSDRGKVEYIS